MSPVPQTERNAMKGWKGMAWQSSFVGLRYNKIAVDRGALASVAVA
jgi:hypothetical protein